MRSRRFCGADRLIAATVLEPASQVRRISDALHQQAVSDPVVAEVLPLIPEICAMVGITLEDFTQSRAYQDIFGLGEATVTLRLLARRCGPLSEATTAPALRHCRWRSWRRWLKHSSTSAAQATSPPG